MRIGIAHAPTEQKCKASHSFHCQRTVRLVSALRIHPVVENTPSPLITGERCHPLGRSIHADDPTSCRLTRRSVEGVLVLPYHLAHVNSDELPLSFRSYRLSLFSLTATYLVAPERIITAKYGFLMFRILSVVPPQTL